MTFVETQRRRPLTPWVALSALCLASAVGGGIFVSRLHARRATMPSPESAGVSAAAAESGDEVKALRSEVARLARAVGALAAKPVPSAAAKDSPEAQKARTPMQIPPEVLVSKEDLLTRYTGALPNPQRTRTLESSIMERFKKDSLAAAKIDVDEVDCRGDVCRARVSFADEAAPDAIALEMAGAIPDNHSFQEIAAAGDHRLAMTSIYLAN